MSEQQPTRQTSDRVEHLARRLERDFGDRHSSEAITAQVAAEVDRMARESSVQTFVPILAERRLRKTLDET